MLTVICVGFLALFYAKDDVQIVHEAACHSISS